MSDDDLKGELEALKTRLAELEAALCQQSAFAANDGAMAAGPMALRDNNEQAVRQAFRVTWNESAPGWDIYFPAGSFTYDGQSVPDNKVSPQPVNGVVTLTVANIGTPTTESIYLHLKFDEDDKLDRLHFSPVADDEFGTKHYEIAKLEADTVTQVVIGAMHIGGEGGGEGKDVVGSEYIGVDDDEDAQGNVNREVSAKVVTSNEPPEPEPGEVPEEHALLTHDTDQLVRGCSKTFLAAGHGGSANPAGLARVIIDGNAGNGTDATIVTRQAGSSATKTIEISAAEGTETLSTGGDKPRKIFLNPSQMDAEDESKTIEVRKLTFCKGEDDEEPTVIQFLGSKNATVDLGKGKLIKSTSVSASADPGGQNTLVFNYTDGSSDTFIIMNGLNGAQGAPGSPGSTPVITGIKTGGHTYIYSNGVLIADLMDGNSPQITASKSGGVTTIYADGNPIATINDGVGSDGNYVKSLDSLEFSENNGKLEALLYYKKGDGETALLKGELGNIERVVVRSSYNASGDRKFFNHRKKAIVLESTEIPSEVFEATPHSEEMDQQSGGAS